MLTGLILLTILTTALTKRDMIPRSSARPEVRSDETKFWSSVLCQAGRRRTISLHETFQSTTTTNQLRDFFVSIVTNLQTECVSEVTIKFHPIDEKINDSTTTPLFYEKQYPANLPIILSKSMIDDKKITSTKHSFMFQFKDIEIIVTRFENSVRTLVYGNILDNLDDMHHVIVFMIFDNNDFEKSSKSLTNIIAIILSRLWHERGILNVSIVVPFTHLDRRLWFYDPFYKNATSGMWGRIFAVDPDGVEAVNRVNNLNGYKLNVGMFETTSAAVKLDRNVIGEDFPFTKNSRGYGGLDGSTMAMIANHMNFELTIVPPQGGIEYGYVEENGTFVGTIGDVAYHRVDMSFNSMYVKIYTPNGTSTSSFEFTVPIDFDRLCVVVPRAAKIPRWLRTFYCFDPAIWCCLLLTQFLVSIVWYYLRKCQNSLNRKSGPTTNYHELLLETFLLFVGAPLKLNVSQLEKIILTTLLLLGLTVMGTFTGTLYHSFTNDIRYREMKTLKDVDDSGIDIGTASPNLYNVFGQHDGDETAEEVKNLRRKYKIFRRDDLPTIEKTAYQRNVAGLSREHSFELLKYVFVDETGNGQLHLVEECPRAYHLAYIVPKNSVYINRLNVLIRRIQSAGLPPLWNSVVMNRLAAEARSKAHLKRRKPLRASFTIKDVQTSFLILFVGHLVATCVFIVEMCCNRKR